MPSEEKKKEHIRSSNQAGRGKIGKKGRHRIESKQTVLPVMFGIENGEGLRKTTWELKGSRLATRKPLPYSTSPSRLDLAAS